MSRLLKITDLGSGIMVQGTDNVLYPDNATLTYPYNSIVVVTDESDIATFRSASNNDVLFSGLIGKIEIGNETVTKQNINAKFDAIANQESGGGDVTGLFADASYDSQTKHINFYDKDNTLVAYVDATDFIKDGMVSNVEILNGNLVITFNTDAGKEPITIPLTDIFNPNNYYTKTDANALFATQVVVNEEIAARIAGDSALQTALGGKADKTDTYTKSQIDDALALKQDTISDLSTIRSGAALGATAYQKPNDGIPASDLASGVIPTVPTNVSAFTNDAGYLTQHQSLDNYYTKTQVDTALAAKVSQSEFDTKEEVISTVLNDLDENKADKTEIPDVTNLATKAEVNTALADKADKATTYTKTETDTAISTAIGQIDLSDYETKDDADVKEEVISTALNNLNTNKQDKLTAGQNITIQNNVISATGGGGTQVQSDWNQTDDTAVDYIKNKPTIPDTSDFVTKAEYNPKELAIAEALTDLNENKADKTEIPDVSTLATKTELNAKQDTLVSGTNIKTINNQSILGSGNINISGGGDYVQYDSQDEYPVTLIKRMNRLDYEALAGNEDPNTLYIVTPIEWKVFDDNNFQFGDGNPTDLFAQTLPAQLIAMNEYPTVTLHEDLDKSSSPIQGSWSYNSSAYIGTLTWTDSDGGSCSMVIEFTIIGGSDIVIDDASKITYTNPNNHCYTVEWQ